MAEALEAAMPPGTRFRSPRGGSAIWVELPGDVDAQALAVAARTHGIAYGEGEPFRIDAPGPAALLLSFAVEPPDAIRSGITRLATLVSQCAHARPAARAGGRSR
jgi:DNA-binding transcriptional MocR family regulator